MDGRKSATQGLKALSKGIDWDDPSAASKYSSSLWRENDRGAIILTGSALEEVLQRQIKISAPHLNSADKDALFGFNGPIGTFSNKLRIAHVMGLISRDTYQRIDLVREMRNACAHSREPISFDQPAIRDATIAFAGGLRIDIGDDKDQKDLRQAFLLAGVLMMATVLKGSVNDAHADLSAVLARHGATLTEKPG